MLYQTSKHKNLEGQNLSAETQNLKRSNSMLDLKTQDYPVEHFATTRISVQNYSNGKDSFTATISAKQSMQEVAAQSYHNAKWLSANNGQSTAQKNSVKITDTISDHKDRDPFAAQNEQSKQQKGKSWGSKVTSEGTLKNVSRD